MELGSKEQTCIPVPRGCWAEGFCSAGQDQVERQGLCWQRRGKQVPSVAMQPVRVADFPKGLCWNLTAPGVFWQGLVLAGEPPESGSNAEIPLSPLPGTHFCLPTCCSTKDSFYLKALIQLWGFINHYPWKLNSLVDASGCHCLVSRHAAPPV